MNLVLIFVGGGLGSILRYLANSCAKSIAGNDFPYGILAVNVIGSFIIGFVAGILRKEGALIGLGADHATSFFIIGILGGFTTFSAFSLDVVNLINQQKLSSAVFYIAASVTLSIAAAFVGMAISK